MSYGMGLLGLIPFVFGALPAQSTSSLTIEAGALSIQQPLHRAATAGTIAIAGRHASTYTAISAAALFVQSSDTSTATQATLGAEFALPQWPSLRAEISAAATSFGALIDARGSSRNVFVRPQWVRRHIGVFSTIGWGVTQRDALRFHALAWDAGAWAQRSRLTGVVRWRRSYTNDFPLLEASNIFLFRPARHYSVQDVEGTLSAQISRVVLQTSGAWRHGFEATRGHGGAWSASATTQLSSHLALVINGGQQLADVLSGVPSAKVFGASLRANFPERGARVGAVRDESASASASASASTIPGGSPFATRVERHATGGATVTVRVDAPVAARVEWSGSFNDWAVVAVPRTANGFEFTLELPGGTHRVAVRVNGGPWRAPTGLARIKDELGGEAGLMVVP